MAKLRLDFTVFKTNLKAYFCAKNLNIWEDKRLEMILQP